MVSLHKQIADYSFYRESLIRADLSSASISNSDERITGFKAEECLAMADFPLSLIFEEDRRLIREALADTINKKHSVQDLPFRVRNSDGTISWMAGSWQPAYDEGKSFICVRTCFRETTEQKKSIGYLQNCRIPPRRDYMNEPRDFYRDVLNNLSDGVYFIDKDKKITFWNSGAERITGYKREEIIGSCCKNSIINHVNSLGEKTCPVEPCPVTITFQTGKAFEGDLYLIHKNGYRVPVSIRTSAIRENGTEISGVAEVFRELYTKEQNIQRMQELEKLALLDPLTGVGNRRYGENVLKGFRDEFERYNWPFGVLFIDIDDFKQINDSQGHESGDVILKAVSTNLTNNIRPFDQVIRWGGEEFLVILKNVDSQNIGAISEKLRTIIQNSELPEKINIKQVTVSIGATNFQLSDTIEETIRRADRLMYKSKQSGKNRVTFG